MDAIKGKITRLELKYNRISKDPSSNAVCENYSEIFIIDGNNETLEYIRKSGEKYEITQKYTGVSEVAELFADFDEDIFEKIEGNPTDAIDDPTEIRTYRIIVSYEGSAYKIISGSFDIKGLPDEWEWLSLRILKIIASYGNGEMFDPRCYSVQKLCSDTVIYLSVRFFESYKNYYYQTTDNTIKVGDLVVVPVGNDGTERIVEVKEKEYFKRDEVPMPLDVVKSVIEKFTPFPSDDPIIYCPALKKNICSCECYEMSYGMRSIPGFESDEEYEEFEKTCKRCRYHE